MVCRIVCDFEDAIALKIWRCTRKKETGWNEAEAQFQFTPKHGEVRSSALSPYLPLASRLAPEAELLPSVMFPGQEALR